ncbi:MAG: ABC transporter permease subunit [Vulcanisaeta sp.]
MRKFWLVPYLLYILGFGLIPLILTFYFVGFNPSSIRGLIIDFPPGTFNLALFNTLLFATVTALISTLLALILAIRVDSLPMKWQIPMSLIILMPYTIPFMASSMIWYTLFDPMYGPLYYLFKVFHIPMLNMTTIPGLSIWAVIIVGIWNSTSFAYLIIIGGLKAISKELKEVAQIDGASLSQYYGGVALPYIFKIVITAFLMIFVLQLGNFDIPYVLTEGGPGYSSTTLPLLVFDLLYFIGNFSGGEAAAALLAAMATLPAAALLYLMRSTGGLYVRLPTIKIPDRLYDASLWILTIIILVFLLFPVYWMVVLAFRPDIYDFISPPILYPIALTGKYFIEALSSSVPYIVTSLVVGIFVAVITAILAGTASYIMSKYNVYWLLLITMYLYSLPSTSFIFPIYILFMNTGLLNTWWALIMADPIFTVTLSAWLLFNIYRDLPNEYQELAEIEGASSTYILFRVIAPITRSSWFMIMILSFIISWQLLFYPLILTETPWQFNFPPTGAQTVTIFAIEAIRSKAVEWGLLASSALVVALPVMVLSYIIMGRLLEGFNIGGLKG